MEKKTSRDNKIKPTQHEFFENEDLLSHMFELVDVNERGNLTMVAHKYKKITERFSEWRVGSLEISFEKDNRYYKYQYFMEQEI